MPIDTLLFLAKTLIAALIIAGASSLAQRQPTLAGYITALPLTSVLALTFAYLQTRDSAAIAKYAVSVFAAVPISLAFFVPFLLYDRLKGSFWACLGLGLALLYAGYFLQKLVVARFLS
jgi:hypothetical protein